MNRNKSDFLLFCSGLSHESHRRDVEQVYLRCSQGSLEWLYPTGAIIVNIRPNTEPSSGRAAGVHACIKPQPYSQVNEETNRGLDATFGSLRPSLHNAVTLSISVAFQLFV